MGALVRVNAGIEKGQVRQGLGCGSDRRLSYRAVSATLQGCKHHLTGLQALPCRVVSSTLQGCKLYLTGL